MAVGFVRCRYRGAIYGVAIEMLRLQNGRGLIGSQGQGTLMRVGGLRGSETKNCASCTHSPKKRHMFTSLREVNKKAKKQNITLKESLSKTLKFLVKKV